jgi:hypothetical protein
MVKLEPVEFDNNDIIVSTTLIAASMSHSTSMKRSRKAVHPSKTIKIPKRTPPMNQLTNTIHYIPIEESSPTTDTSTDDDVSNLQFNHIDEQDNNHKDGIDMDEGNPLIHHHVPSKRPRLSYNKRLQANARERARVHNLTAAFEALRQVIPMYDGQPKLSRLSILRIACSYVLVLGALNEIDFSEGQNAYTLNESFHLLSCTILNELKRKRPTNDRNY